MSVRFSVSSSLLEGYDEPEILRSSSRQFCRVLSPMMAAMESNSPMHCHVGPFKSVEAVMRAPWVWEAQIPAVLWTEYGSSNGKHLTAWR
jgi:hypothetical protein